MTRINYGFVPSRYTEKEEEGLIKMMEKLSGKQVKMEVITSACIGQKYEGRVERTGAGYYF